MNLTFLLTSLKYFVLFSVIYNICFFTFDYFKINIDFFTDMIFLFFAAEITTAYFFKITQRLPSESEQKILIWGYIASAWITSIVLNFISIGNKPFAKIFDILFPDKITLAIVFVWIILIVILFAFILVQYFILKFSLNWSKKLYIKAINKFDAKKDN